MRQLQPLIADHLLKYHRVRFYQYQWRITAEVLEALIENLLIITGEDITEVDIEAMESVARTYEYTRQSGKTTTLVHIIEIIMVFVTRLFNMPIEVGIFAPQKHQANTDFKRLKNALSRSRKDLTIKDHDANRKAKEESNARTIVLGNGSSCFISPVTATSKPESPTLHIIFLEEAQDLDDVIVNEQILPIGTSTNAVVVRVGSAGTQTCDFYWLIQTGQAYTMQYPEIAADRRAMFNATGEARHLVYEKRVKNDIAKYGQQDPRIQRPYFNVWQLHAGMYIQSPELYAGRVELPFEHPAADPAFKEYAAWYRSGRHNLPEVEQYAGSHNISAPLLAQYRAWLEENHYFGLDTAKATDQTVLKIARMIEGRLTIVRSLQGMRGMNYQDQFETILAELKWFKIAAGAIDATGQGDFMPDLFEKNTGYKIYRVPFSRQSKDHIYTSLYQKQVNNGFAYYYQDPAKANADAYTAKAAAEFETEFLQLTKRQVGEYMVVEHPAEANAHDDHPDSTALVSNAYDSYNVTSGLMGYYKGKAAEPPQPAGPPPKFRGKPLIPGA